MNKINISENQKSIMLCKIQFLQKQLEESSRREQTLQQINQQLRNAIPELINDKSRIEDMMRNDSVLNDSQFQIRDRQKQRQIENLKSKLRELSESNAQYQKELKRMEKNMKQHIESIQMTHQRNIRHYQKKIECFQLKLSKYNNYSELEDQLQELRVQNKQLKKKLRQNNNLPLNISQINTSQIELESIIKNLNQKDTTFTLEDIENVSFNRIPTQSDCSSIKQSMAMTRSRSGVSEIKKNVISSLYCEECQHNYAPNQYYRHLEIHEQKARLEEEKKEIEKRLKSKEQRRRLEGQLSKVSVALKQHEKRTCSSARNLIRF